MAIYPSSGTSNSDSVLNLQTCHNLILPVELIGPIQYMVAAKNNYQLMLLSPLVTEFYSHTVLMPTLCTMFWTVRQSPDAYILSIRLL